MLGSFAPTVTSAFALSTIAHGDVETIDGYAVCGGVPAQDGLGIVRSYGLNLPKF